jgi:peptidoglycan/LPS O-acetylase OafA/YrhL
MSQEMALWLSKAVAGGGLGVVLFFVLSSYLITELLLRESEQRGTLDVKSFYIRRALRIWPLYFVFLIVVYLIIPQQSVYSIKPNIFVAMLLFVGNWACVISSGMGSSVTGPLWSISVEEQFYIAWPLIISKVGVKHLQKICLGLIVFSNLTRVVMEKKGAGFIAFWCSTVTWFDAIAAGALLAIFLRGGVPRWSTITRLALSFGGLLVWLLSIRFHDRLIYPDIAYFPLVVFGSCLILLGVLGSNLRLPLLVYLGRISYGLYVFHAAALALASLVFVNYSPLHALAGLVITVTLGSISYAVLEQPFLRLKKRFTYVTSGRVALAETGTSILPREVNPQ